MIGSYVIVRTYSAGAFAGTLVRREGKEVELSGARRLWYWKGANSLSDIALYGVKAPKECKFPAAVSTIVLTEAIEIIPATDEAKASIEGVPEWKA
jgi:hypothetical protein